MRRLRSSIFPSSVPYQTIFQNAVRHFFQADVFAIQDPDQEGLLGVQPEGARRLRDAWHAPKAECRTSTRRRACRRARRIGGGARRPSRPSQPGERFRAAARRTRVTRVRRQNASAGVPPRRPGLTPGRLESARAVIVHNAGVGSGRADATIDRCRPEDAFFHARFARRGPRPLARRSQDGRHALQGVPYKSDASKGVSYKSNASKGVSTNPMRRRASLHVIGAGLLPGGRAVSGGGASNSRDPRQEVKRVRRRAPASARIDARSRRVSANGDCS